MSSGVDALGKAGQGAGRAAAAGAAALQMREVTTFEAHQFSHVNYLLHSTCVFSRWQPALSFLKLFTFLA